MVSYRNRTVTFHSCIDSFRPDNEALAKKVKKGAALGYAKDPGPIFVMEWFRIVLGKS